MTTRTAQDMPFIPAPRITTVAGYLLIRLAEAGVISVFGVPGDDNLPLLDAITARPDLAWIGMATAQGAGYAADSYARLRGLGARVTTFGVGELSAMNAIAGAYAESVPMVHIVGTPALPAREPDGAAATPHHNLPGRDYGHFARMAAEVTAAQADLRPATAPEEIDRVLSTALRASRPVYLTIPADTADMPVRAPVGRLPAAAEQADPAARHRVTSQVRELAIAGNPPAAMQSTIRDQRLTQASLWAAVQRFLRPGDLLFVDQGTASYAAAQLTLPDGAQLVSRPLWASIGWGVPAVLGASLAAPDRRVVLVAGDGAMQQAAAELGTLLGQGLAPVIIVLNNGGSTTERVMGHPGASYHDIPAWAWTALPAVAPASSVAALRVRRSDELAWALNAADYDTSAGRPALVEAILDAEDAAPLLQDLAHAAAAARG